MGLAGFVKRALPDLLELAALCAGVAFDGHDDADAQHHREHGRSAVTDKGQRNAGNRGKAHDHQQVDHDVKENRAGQASGDQLAIAGLALHRDG